MALHRDIFWVGKQWAVTGYGIQACDQKQKGKFDIEASRIWEDGILDSVRAQKWLNIKDFDKAIAAAREHYPEPSRKKAPPAPPEKKKVPRAKADAPGVPGAPVAPPKPESPKFEMRIESWPAKFVPLWRVRIKR
jgi:hypothetical protein